MNLDAPCHMMFYLGYFPEEQAVAVTIPFPILFLISLFLLARIIAML
jgi:hypothetical protein